MNDRCTLSRECCPPWKCERCGWNIDEAKRRKARIRRGEMKKNEQGLKYLPVKPQPKPQVKPLPQVTA